MKQPTNKPATNLDHNNPPEDIKSIEFTNSAIEKPEPRTQFDSKVEEDIYRAKKFLLKKNGHWD